MSGEPGRAPNAGNHNTLASYLLADYFPSEIQQLALNAGREPGRDEEGLGPTLSGSSPSAYTT